MVGSIRVLQVFHGMDCGGAENMIMNLYRNIDREKVQFDFLVHTKKKCFFDDEIKSLGGRIYHVPYYNVKNHFTYRRILEIFFKKHPEINIVHGHLGSCAHVYLRVAKSFGCFTIAHSHSVGNRDLTIKSFLYRLFTLKVRKTADYFFSCGNDAGLSRFGSNITKSSNYDIIKNAIDINRFSFNEIIRNTIRNEYQLENSFVIGHVGRFDEYKNQMFLVDLFINKFLPFHNIKLLLVGDGICCDRINQKIQEYNIEDRVVLTGTKSNVQDYLFAMDCFAFPSKFEGLPLTVVEAQTAGLPCILSDNVTSEVDVSKSVTYLPITPESDCYDKWFSEIMKIRNNPYRINCLNDVVESGYEIEKSTKYLEDFYIKHCIKRDAKIKLF